MANNWYYGQGGQQQGPVSFETLKQLARSGILTAEHLVWTEGMADWLPAEQIADLMPKPEAAGVAEWYYGRNGQQHGPIRLAELQQLALTDQLKPNDMVWKQGLPDWTAASGIAELSFNQPATAPPPPGPPPSPGRSRDKRVGTTSGIVISTLRFIGLGLLLLAFVTPWWSYVFYKLSPDAGSEFRNVYSEALSEGNRVVDETIKWTTEKLGDSGEKYVQEDKYTASVSIGGWNTGTGLMGLIFFFLLTPLATVFMLVKPLKPWSWIVSFITALFGFLMMIMFLVWYFGAPSQNVAPVMAQGLSIGPYLALLAGFLLMGTGILDGILGLRSLRGSSKANPA